MSTRVRTIIGALLVAATFGIVAGSRPASAQPQCPGDCNGNGAVGAAEVTKVITMMIKCPCSGGFIGGAASGCPEVPGTDKTCAAADYNGNSCVSAAELTRMIQNLILYAPGGCPPSGPTATPTTGVVVNTPTSTPTIVVVPNTPTSTPSQVPPTATATEVPPTATATPLPPTVTPTATITPTMGTRVVPVRIAPGGGGPLSCQGTCSSGPTPGKVCGNTADCGTGGTCGGTKKCSGGPYKGLTCTGPGQCNGCMPSARCTGAGQPIACCTAAGKGNCPLLGSCAVVQNKNAIVVPRISLSGICTPRNGDNGDVGCTNDSDCRSCVGGDRDGDACLPGQGAPGSGQADPCPGGTCTGNASTCLLPGLTMEISDPDPTTGEAAVRIPRESLVLMPAAAGSIGTVCVTGGSDGVGVIDCNGGKAGVDVTLRRDHNIKPGSPGNSGSASGLPDDPECDDNYTLPDGSPSLPCVEGAARCNGGTNKDQLCSVESDCPPVDPDVKRCAQCNTATNIQHPGVCNSPTKVELSGSFAPGDARVSMPLALVVLKGALAPGEDKLACTADDQANPASPVGVLLSSGTSKMYVYDVNNTANNKIAPQETCTNIQCVAEIDGSEVASCSAMLDQGDVGGLQVAGGFAAFDIDTTLDLVTVFQFKLEKPQ
ncbi:hypothetical protein L6Q96_19850 [Candidatus Binatia bacterium]|nr:hypothetical protein [Candidatus Binatia bacterium]